MFLLHLVMLLVLYLVYLLVKTVGGATATADDGGDYDVWFPLDGMPNGELHDCQEYYEYELCNEEVDDDVDEEDEELDDDVDEEDEEVDDDDLDDLDEEDEEVDDDDVDEEDKERDDDDVDDYSHPHPLNLRTYKYDKYLYVHKMIPGYFHCLKNQSFTHKDQYRGPLDECSFIEKAIHVDIASQIFYCFNGFDKLPHRSTTYSKQEYHEKVLAILGNKESGITIKKITTAETYNIIHNAIKIFYPGSNVIAMFHNLDIHYDYWLEKFWKMGRKTHREIHL